MTAEELVLDFLFVVLVEPAHRQASPAAAQAPIFDEKALQQGHRAIVNRDAEENGSDHRDRGGDNAGSRLIAPRHFLKPDVEFGHDNVTS
jgi:hypothetical protein